VCKCNTLALLLLRAYHLTWVPCRISSALPLVNTGCSDINVARIVIVMRNIQPVSIMTSFVLKAVHRSFCRYCCSSAIVVPGLGL
jgi:hypothetical protein